VTADGDSRELKLLRAKADEHRSSLQAEQQARAVAEAHIESLERAREQLEDQKFEIERRLNDLQQRTGGGDSMAAELEVQRLRSRVEQLQQQVAERSSDNSASTVASAVTSGVDSSVDGRRGCSSTSSAPGGGSVSERPQVRSLVVSGEASVGALLTAQIDLIDADASMSTFAWYRGDSLVSTKESYGVTSDDLGVTLDVRNSLIATIRNRSPATCLVPLACPLCVR